MQYFRETTMNLSLLDLPDNESRTGSDSPRWNKQKKRKKYLYFYRWWYSKYFHSLGNRTPTPSPGPSYWGDPRYSASQVDLSFDKKVAFIFKEFNLKAAELQSALASLPKSFSSQLSQYAQYSNLQQVYLCSRVWFPYFSAKLVLLFPFLCSILFPIIFSTASECAQKWPLLYLLFSLQDTDSHNRRLHSNNPWKNELQEGEQSTSQIQNRPLSNRYQESSRDHQRELLAASRAYESLGSLYGQAALPGEWFSKDLHCFFSTMPIAHVSKMAL